jgi:UDP-N-acetylmuramate dehydrogenase
VSVTGAYDALRRSLVGTVQRDEPMFRHTTYRIGGPADLFIVCDTVNDVSQTLRILAEEEVPYTVLGKGSNLLVADEGYRGAVATLGRDFRRHGLDGNDMRCGAGVTLAGVVRDAYSKGLAGFEFGVGVPGTIGGALVMNAGSRDEWIGSVVESVTVYSPIDGLVRLRGNEIHWAYRESDLSDTGVVLECCLRAEVGDSAMIRQTMEERFTNRKETQPLSQPSAGSVFKNPPGDSAGRMIDTLGAKGMRVGGAMVSDVHGNFIVNAGGASASDVMYLIDAIRTAVKDAYNVELETEIRFLGPIGVS